MVFNTDTREGNGIHWFSLLFVYDGTRCHAEIFDSQNSEQTIQANIKNFAIQSAKQIHPEPKEKLVIATHGKHQKLNSECGVYSMYFLK
jgi:Ulp1 family protease